MKPIEASTESPDVMSLSRKKYLEITKAVNQRGSLQAQHCFNIWQDGAHIRGREGLYLVFSTAPGVQLYPFTAFGSLTPGERTEAQ